MANSNRHRQGVAYGPVRPSGSRDRGRIVGNLLGLSVVAVSAGLLIVGLYLFTQGPGGKPAATPSNPPQTVGPRLSPGATPSSVATASFIQSISPTSPASPGITPAPTLHVPAVVTGPGNITFGTTVDANNQITDAKTTFGVNEPMVWSADLTEPANSADLKIQIYKLDARQPNGQRLVLTDAVQPVATGAQVFFRRLRPLGATLGTGLFTIEYVRGTDVLATGSFLIQ